MAGLVKLLKNKWYPPANPAGDFEGNIVIVTGANTGLGFETALKFVQLKVAKLIIGCRNLEKGKHAQEAIEKQTHRTGVVDVWQLDMDSFQSVVAFAERAKSELEHLDIVVLNAGVHAAEYKKSPEGWEEDLQVNVIATALLGLQLLPKLKESKTSTAHLVVVGSGTHRNANIDKGKEQHNMLQAYNEAEGYNGLQQYGRSKLFAHYVTKELARMAQDPQGKPTVVVNSVCPGMCKSDLARDYDSLFFRAAAGILYTFFARTSEEGSRSIVSAAQLDAKDHGGWWQHDSFPGEGELITSEQGQKFQEQVWKEVLQALGDHVPKTSLDVPAKL